MIYIYIYRERERERERESILNCYLFIIVLKYWEKLPPTMLIEYKSADNQWNGEN